MARTRATVAAKVSSGKSSKARSSLAPSSYGPGPSGLGDKSRSYSGGNPVCPRETPKWQKPITKFFITNASETDDEGPQASTSKQKPKRNVIQSDDENEDSEIEIGNVEIETEIEDSEIKPAKVEIETETEDSEIEPAKVEIETETENSEIESAKGEIETETKDNLIETAKDETEETKYKETETPKNHELDETIELETLNGEDCHKIVEYYPSKVKNKGKGKKSNKENIGERQNSLKRDLEQVIFGEENQHVNKKVKVN